MSEPVWTGEYLYTESKQIAEKLNQELSINHFWAVADRDLAGAAPREIPGLVARAKNYAVFDAAIAKYGIAGDPEIDAAIKRTNVLGSQLSLTSDSEFLRFFCRTNLLFLSREIFNKDLTFSTHARVCNFFVQKNPLLHLEDQDEIKERLLLYPRGHFKSTVDMFDCIQWIINFPDIRILILTAESSLAMSFVEDMKQYFYLREGAEPTVFQMLFREFAFTKRLACGVDGEFICMCRTQGDEHKKEPTVWSAGVLMNLPGWHCDLLKTDDAVNDKNADTPEQIRKVIKRVMFASSLVDPGGYKDLIGTPYAPTDLYTHKKTVTPEENLKFMRVPAGELRPEAESKAEKDWVESDFKSFLFLSDKHGRKKFTWKVLHQLMREDADIFRSQYMLNPSGAKRVKFRQDLLLARTITRDQLPHELVYYILWDFAYAANASNDYSVGAVIGLDRENRAYVIELFRDHYLDSELAREIATSHLRYGPRLIPIENSNGAQFLESTIRRYADEIGAPYIPLDFFKVDRSANAKATRVYALQPLLEDARLFFLNEIGCLTDLYDEFKNFGSAAHDDIPDAISHLHRILPSQVVTEPGGQGGRERAREFERKLKEEGLYRLIFGDPNEYVPAPVPEAPVVPIEEDAQDLVDPFNPWGSK